jgi:hypothetical protein
MAPGRGPAATEVFAEKTMACAIVETVTGERLDCTG